ncbi:MAG: undecaprenyl-diphosphate phosphatase [Bacteroidetes bacterium]|nr:undecaprenyl-diphosphate phosphatase [Bacteroidota bacterium]
MNSWEAFLLAIVEGLTEFLPVSSTGHLSMAKALLGIKDSFSETYIIAIQFGAILSVVALYPRRFFSFEYNFYLKLIIGFIPAAILGYLFDDQLEALLGMPWVVPAMLVSVGFFLVFADRFFPGSEEEEIQEVSNKQAFLAGLSQCAAMVPGVSRSAASIIGGMAAGMNRTTAAAFSFFLAVPTLAAAGLYKVYKNADAIADQNLTQLLLGNAVAFVVAYLAMKGFVQFLKKHGFRLFGWYRIVAGLAFAAWLYLQ